MTDFERGYSFFAEQLDAYLPALEGGAYIADIDSFINDQFKVIQEFFQSNGKAIDFAKGDFAELWHASTFNINAHIHNSTNEATVLRSNELGSIDISVTGKIPKNYSLKYYKNGEESAKAQSISFYEYYKKNYKGDLSFEEYMAKNGHHDAELLRHESLYKGQIRLIPSDQTDDATTFLQRKISSEDNLRPEQIARYRDTKNSPIIDRIKDDEGNESLPLTEKGSRQKLQKVREENSTPADIGLEAKTFLEFDDILKKAFKAGLSSAVISLVLRTAPEIFKSIEHLIYLGEIDAEDFQKVGFAAVQGSAEGFIRGSVSAALTTAIKAGLLGEVIKETSPSIIGAVTVIVMDTMKNAFKVTQGQMTRQEMTNELVRETFVSVCSLVAGGITQMWIEIPVLGFMLGSFLGSMIGSFAYSCGYNAVLSFCVDTGFTMFGLVEQDYKLPENVLEQIGIEVFRYEKFEYEHFEYEKFEYPKFEYKKFVPEQFDYSKLNMVFLRRGVIGVHKIGYV